jgi:hypothetical protein
MQFTYKTYYFAFIHPIELAAAEAHAAGEVGLPLLCSSRCEPDGTKTLHTPPVCWSTIEVSASWLATDALCLADLGVMTCLETSSS